MHRFFITFFLVVVLGFASGADAAEITTNYISFRTDAVAVEHTATETPGLELLLSIAVGLLLVGVVVNRMKD